MLYAVDVDPFELPRTRERLNNQGFGDDVLCIQKMNFSEIIQIMLINHLFLIKILLKFIKLKIPTQIKPFWILLDLI